MTDPMAAFGIAAGGTSQICYGLTTRSQSRRAARGSSRDGSGPDGDAGFGDSGGGGD